MNHSLFSLLQLSDPALPVGGYAHSGGLETYVQGGMVHDIGTAGSFVRMVLSTSVRYTDAALVALAYEAVSCRNWGRLTDLDGLCEAVKASREMRQASARMGNRLMKIFSAMSRGEAVSIPGVDPVFAGIRHYPVVFGYCGSLSGIDLRSLLTGWYYNAAAGMVTNCVKLVPLGQQEGQALLFSLQPLLAELVEAGMAPEEEHIGLCCPGLDIRCMQHENLYSRLYMS